MPEENHRFHLHLISDSTGETVSSIARSVLSLFEKVDPEEHLWTLVRTAGQMERVLEGITENPGIVLFTVMEEKLQDQLRKGCRDIGVPCVPVLSRAIKELSSFLGTEVTAQPGRQYELDEEYFSRVEAINFALAHDDGQAAWELEEADVVLVGPSRTSKTPTCVYLSYRGINAANVPFVAGIPLPENLFTLRHPLVVGLVISPERLVQIRKSRLATLNETRETSYIDLPAIKDEITEARQLFTQHKWPVIDVTRRSIEETVAQIANLLKTHRRKQHDSSDA